MSLSRRQFAATALAPLLPLAEPAPRLLLLIVAEQFRPDFLLRWRAEFADGGFARFLEAGAAYLDCRHLASTFTSTALATLGAGAYPAVHGIVADHWYDRTRRVRVKATPADLRANTLATEVRRAGGAVYAIAPTAANAALIAGDALTRAFFFDEKGYLAPSPYKPDELPWLPAFQNAHNPEQARDKRWVALGAGPEAVPLRTLRYDPNQPDEFYLLFKASPFAEAAQFDLLQELVNREKLGHGDALDLVVVVLGATALLGHETGAYSPLIHQMVLHLDLHLAAVFEHLDRTLGPNRYLAAFTAAHGVAALPAPRLAVDGEALAKTVDGALGGDAVDRYVYPFLYLKPGPRSRDGRLAAARAALRFPGVAGFYTQDGECSHHGDWRRRMENSFHAGRSGDVMLTYAPEYTEDFEGAPAISYGSIYNYDAQTPLLFYGAPFRTRVVERTVEAVDVTPTLARACNLPLPSSSTGRVLRDAFVPSARPDRK
jgi:hypothetical protein